MTSAPHEPVRVLIVEDDPVQAETLSRILAADDREVLVAPDGDSGPRDRQTRLASRSLLVPLSPLADSCPRGTSIR